MTALIPSINPPSGTGAEPKQANIAPPKFRHNLIDTRETPISDILTAIRGAPMTVIYYAQVLGASQQPLVLQSGTIEVFQQYKKINNLVMAVQTDFQTSQDQQTTEFTITGSAITYPHFVPTKNDHFLASLRSGKMGLFTVTEVSRKSMYNQSVHEIEYELVAWVDQSLVNELDIRVVEELYFNMELLRSNREPFLTPDENVAFLDLRERFMNIGERIKRTFYDRYINTLRVPEQGNFRIIDPFYNKFYELLYGQYDEFESIRSMSHYRIEALTAHNAMTIYNLLAKRSTKMYDMVEKELAPLSRTAFARYVQYGSVFYSNVDYVVFPVTQSVLDEAGADAGLSGAGQCGCVNTTAEPPQSDNAPWYIGWNDEAAGSTITKDVPDADNPPAVLAINYLKPITIDDYYIFSESFYNALDGSEPVGCSIFELMVLDYLNRRPLDQHDLTTLLNDIPNWSRLQQFYYLPILGLLVLSFLGDI